MTHSALMDVADTFEMELLANDPALMDVADTFKMELLGNDPAMMDRCLLSASAFLIDLFGCCFLIVLQDCGRILVRTHDRRT
jgi:hypothetical protein